MFLVLDGADAVGKTTLADHFAKLVGKTTLDDTVPAQDGVKYVHMTYIKDNREMFLANYMALIQAQVWLHQGFHVVMDRGWLSENVYAGVYRGGSGLAYDVRGLDRVIQRLCGVYVVCAPHPDSAVKRHAESHAKRQEMYAPDERIREVAQRYYDLWHGVEVDGVRRGLCDDYVQCLIDAGGMCGRQDAILYDIDVQADDLNGVLDRAHDLSAMLKQGQYVAAFDRAQQNYLGNKLSAHTLFVGDCINPKKKGRWPFVDYGASSRVISQALHRLGFDETKAMWTNANDADEHAFVLAAADPLLNVVALGGNAARKLEELGVPHKAVYHPAFVGRFGRMNEYISQLQSVLP